MKEDYTIIDSNQKREVSPTGLLLIALWSTLPTVLIIIATILYNNGVF